jgi:hypothetical protein
MANTNGNDTASFGAHHHDRHNAAFRGPHHDSVPPLRYGTQPFTPSTRKTSKLGGLVVLLLSSMLLLMMMAVGESNRIVSSRDPPLNGCFSRRIGRRRERNQSIYRLALPNVPNRTCPPPGMDAAPTAFGR